MKRKIKDIVFGTTEADIAISHCLEGCLVDMIKEFDHETLQTKEVDIVLTIDGKEYNHELFFKHLSDKYFHYMKGQVKQMLIQDTIDKIQFIQNALEDMKNQIDCLNSNIDYEMEFLQKSMK